MVCPQQHVGVFSPLHIGGAALVTVSSHPQPALVQRYTSPARNGICLDSSFSLVRLTPAP